MLIVGVSLIVTNLALIIFEEMRDAKSRRALSARAWSVTCRN